MASETPVKIVLPLEELFLLPWLGGGVSVSWVGSGHLLFLTEVLWAWVAVGLLLLHHHLTQHQHHSPPKCSHFLDSSGISLRTREEKPHGLLSFLICKQE